MKFSATAAALLATGVLAVDSVKPQFLNSAINPQVGVPFTLKYSGCQDGCTISLQKGSDPNNLAFDRVLDSNANGESTAITLTNISSGQYNFLIKSNKAGSEPNYSASFQVEGDIPSTSSTDPDATTKSESIETTPAPITQTTKTSVGSTAMTRVTPAPSGGTSINRIGSNITTTSRPPTPPSSGSVASLAPLGLVGAAAVAVLLL